MSVVLIKQNAKGHTSYTSKNNFIIMFDRRNTCSEILIFLGHCQSGSFNVIFDLKLLLCEG